MEATNPAQQEQQPADKVIDPAAKDLWAYAAKKQAKVAQQSKTFVFVGEKKSGKSSLITKFLEQQVKEEMPETTAMNYTSGVKVSKDDKKVKVNMYELGGGRSFATLLESAMSGGSIQQTTVVIVIDLSKPGNAIGNLLFWLNAVREQSQAALENLANSNPQAFQTMQEKVKAKWEEHEDANKVNYSMVPIVILGSKFDQFANQYESRSKKTLCMAMRYIAHVNTCDLVFGSVKEKLPSQLYRAVLNSHAFDGQVGHIDMNHNNPINCPSGKDSLSKIDEPDGAQQRSKASLDSLWQDVCERDFEKIPEQSAQASKLLAGMAKYPEEKVDQMRRQKDEELEHYVKQTQRAKRFESKQQQQAPAQAAQPQHRQGAPNAARTRPRPMAK